MSTADTSLRQRGQKDKQKANGKLKDDVDALLNSAKDTAVSEWDYKLALSVITVLAFITRFFGISHPDEVVFDEVHFGKVCGFHTVLETDILIYH